MMSILTTLCECLATPGQVEVEKLTSGHSGDSKKKTDAIASFSSGNKRGKTYDESTLEINRIIMNHVTRDFNC